MHVVMQGGLGILAALLGEVLLHYFCVVSNLLAALLC